MSAAAQAFAPAVALARRQRRFLQATWLRRPPRPRWHTPNRVLRETPAHRLRDFSAAAGGPDAAAAGGAAGRTPVLLIPPEVNASTIVDFGAGQSLVAAVRAAGFARVAAIEWRTARAASARRGIDDSLRTILDSAAALGGRVHLIGVCQGGWEAACAAALQPEIAASLTLAAAPIDFHAGLSAVAGLARGLPMRFFQSLVAAGGGRMPGAFIAQGFDNLMPFERHWLIPLTVWNHLDDQRWMARYQRLGDWYRANKDLPGPMYLQAVEQLFKHNRLIRGRFQALGRTVDLERIRCPLALVAGARDHITPPPQVWAAEQAMGSRHVLRREVPAGHVGSFMGRSALRDHWPEILAWLAAAERADGPAV